MGWYTFNVLKVMIESNLQYCGNIAQICTLYNKFIHLRTIKVSQNLGVPFLREKKLTMRSCLTYPVLLFSLPRFAFTIHFPLTSTFLDRSMVSSDGFSFHPELDRLAWRRNPSNAQIHTFPTFPLYSRNRNSARGFSPLNGEIASPQSVK